MSVTRLEAEAFQVQKKDGSVQGVSQGKPIPVDRKVWLTLSRFGPGGELNREALNAGGYIFQGGWRIEYLGDGSVAVIRGTGWKNERYGVNDSGYGNKLDGMPKPPPGYVMDSTDAVKVEGSFPWTSTQGTNVVIRFMKPGTYVITGEDGVVPGLESSPVTYTAEERG